MENIESFIKRAIKTLCVNKSFITTDHRVICSVLLQLCQPRIVAPSTSLLPALSPLDVQHPLQQLEGLRAEFCALLQCDVHCKSRRMSKIKLQSNMCLGKRKQVIPYQLFWDKIHPFHNFYFFFLHILHPVRKGDLQELSANVCHSQVVCNNLEGEHLKYPNTSCIISNCYCFGAVL